MIEIQDPLAKNLLFSTWNLESRIEECIDSLTLGEV